MRETPIFKGSEIWIIEYLPAMGENPEFSKIIGKYEIFKKNVYC